MKNGRLVAFEGLDAAGKSTLVEELAAKLKGEGIDVLVTGELRSPIADVIRSALKNGASPFLKTYLFATDRAWTYECDCLPALERGALVLWDRYVASAVVYRAAELEQGLSRSSPFTSNLVAEVNKPFRGADLTILLDIDVTTSRRRSALAGRNEPYSDTVLEAVRSNYEAYARENATSIARIDANREVAALVSEVSSTLLTKFADDL